MKPEEIEALIKLEIPDSDIAVEGEGCNFAVTVISQTFEGESRVQRQKRVLSAVTEQISCGALHAISVKTYTPEEA